MRYAKVYLGRDMQCSAMLCMLYSYPGCGLEESAGGFGVARWSYYNLDCACGVFLNLERSVKLHKESSILCVIIYIYICLRNNSKGCITRKDSLLMVPQLMCRFFFCQKTLQSMPFSLNLTSLAMVKGTSSMVYNGK
jgi:hypothetical protein